MFNTNQDSYIAFRDVVKERTGSLVIWAGSGISASGGLPTWNSLRENLINCALRKAESFCTDDATTCRNKIENIKKEENNWVVFQRLKDLIGQTSYRETIKSALTLAESIPPPPLYTQLWKLRPRGFINLNIDKLATRSFALFKTQRATINELSGKKCGEMLQVLQDPKPFIANLHGTFDDVTSWVFTKDDLTKLLADVGYTTFVRSCLANNIILFIGISADDIAAGGHLQRLMQKNIIPGTHYWITDRQDQKTDLWAENAGIRTIRYSSSENHEELSDFLDLVYKYIPIDDNNLSAVVYHTKSSKSAPLLPCPNEVVNYDANDIRVILNYHANLIINNNTESSNKAFADFCEKYDEAIYRSWYTDIRPGKNKLFDYTLTKYRGRGAFGKVYQATDESGNIFAVKILLEEIRRDHELLNSFRRGIRSMKILSSHDVQGMVQYKDASEIPAFVVMDWIDGPDLKKVIESKQITSWGEIIEIAAKLTELIHCAHSLPERVLHRDIRPTNIMLRDYYTDPDHLDVVVLDFDLSWHKGSTELSVIHGSSSLGFLAPEQIQSIKGVSTRHAAVDSFGLGMTFYYMISGINPIPDQHKHKDWEETLISASKAKPTDEWTSIGNRFARLILNATQDKQYQRWDVNQISLELQRLTLALNDGFKINSAELIAEELLARSNFSNRYKWNTDQCCPFVASQTGLIISLIPNEADKTISLKVNRTRQEYQNRKVAGRNVKPKVDQALAMLNSLKWKTLCNDSDPLLINFACRIDIEQISTNPSLYISNLEKVFELLSYV
ncbi:MAG: protein kinase domain-containing protein [Solidesulfovibrio sp. DCME]|uniref:protein kinase domain-containing protein n=1 Tax=Solidesulfovibrio sp. DCME TaxID=3447380 RepID=UPI003D110A99